MERGETMKYSNEISYMELKKIQGFVKAAMARKGNIYDNFCDELDEAQKGFERWSAGMEREMVKGND
jgi:hypothetical protein